MSVIKIADIFGLLVPPEISLLMLFMRSFMLFIESSKFVCCTSETHQPKLHLKKKHATHLLLLNLLS